MKIRPAPPAIAAMAFAFPAIMGNSRFLGFLRDQLDEPLLASLLRRTSGLRSTRMRAEECANPTGSRNRAKGSGK